MTENQYQEFLKNVPDHNSPEFLEFLKKNNNVIYDGLVWLVIENCKYSTAEKPWYTAFFKFTGNPLDYLSMLNDYDEWEWVIKAPHKRSVKRFHVHLIQK